MAYSKNSSIPSNKYVFYRRVFDVLFAEHDSATKIGFEREIKTQLNQEVLEQILKIFSFLSFFENQFDFKKDYIFNLLEKIKDKSEELKFRNNDFIEDMKLSIGLWTEDCGTFEFSHRSMQEYFAAVYVSNIKTVSNKKKVYKKIISRNSNHDFNVDNFLSLCLEMDKDFFLENYSLPQIKKALKLFSNNKGELLYTLPFLSGGFAVSKNKNNKSGELGVQGYMATDNLLFLIMSFVTSEKSFRMFPTRIASLLAKNFNDPLFSKYMIKKKNNRFSPPKNDLQKEYLDFLKKIGVIAELKLIHEELKEMKKNIENELNEGKLIEDDFITMI